MLGKIFGRFSGWGAFFLRLALGAIFIIRGGQHLFGIFGGAGLNAFSHNPTLLRMGLMPPLIGAIAIGAIELLGGIFLVLGIAARGGALLLTLLSAGAIITTHPGRGFLALQFPVLILAACISVLLTGPGRASLRD